MTLYAQFHRARGFTLTELLIVITIAAILSAIGIPSYRTITDSARIAGEINGLLGDLLLGRSEAIKQGWPVTVCISPDGAACATTGLTWQSGWIVFVDKNNDQTVNGGEAPMKVQSTFSGTDTFVSDNTRTITFNREGYAELKPGGGATASTLITLHSASPTITSTRCLAINHLGRMVVQRAGAGVCT
jgi:type IV fimbrial biogenesis protein FimT